MIPFNPREEFFPAWYAATYPDAALANIQTQCLRPDPVPAWLSTSEAAAHLGIDRGHLDRVAASACESLPGVCVRVGEGRTRQTYRWCRDRVGEALAIPVAETPKAKRRKPRKASTAKRGGSLRSLLAD